MLSDEKKAAIDALSLEELREEVMKENRSRFQGEGQDYLLARFARLRDEQAAAAAAEERGLLERQAKAAEEANQIAKEASRTAAEANRLSKISIWVAVGAVVVALFAFAQDFRERKADDNPTPPAVTAN